MLLSIIIVNYNVANEIIDCLESIIKTIKIEHEVIVVDNNSSERDIELLSKKFPFVHFCYLEKNIGFSQANNYGVKISRGDFILFLNPDTILIVDFISPILDFFYQNKDVGACSPMLLNQDLSYQNSTGIKLGYIYEFSEAFMLINFLRKFYNRRLNKKIRNNNPVPVRWISAACLFISKDLFNKMGGFNTEFFLNYEDIDLCERINAAGYKNYYFPNLKCIHLDQQSQTKNYEKFVFNRYLGRIVYAKNHYGFIKKNIIKIFHLCGIYLRLILTNINYSGKERIERSRGYKKALKLYL